MPVTMLIHINRRLLLFTAVVGLPVLIYIHLSSDALSTTGNADLRQK